MAHSTKKIILTDEQIAWLKEVYPNMRNEDIARRLGMAKPTLRRFILQYGLKKSEEYYNRSRYQPGHDRTRERGVEAEKLRAQRISESNRRVRKKEHARVLFGLPQRTKLSVVRQNRGRVSFRYYLKKKGYILDEENRIAYYDEHTRRSKRMESRDQRWYDFFCSDATEKSVT